jgi:abortive infection bacteriophage resistance protein
VKYAKPWLTLDQQATLLIERGLAGDPEQIKTCLAAVNYYRLSGYLYPFRNSDDSFRPGTTFETVWNRYVFDRHLRLLVMDAIERIEVAVRSQLAYHHAQQHGPFGYADDPTSLMGLLPAKRQDFLQRVQEETDRSHETFVAHFRDKYGDCHPYLPVWMATEVMAFGTVLTFFRGAPHPVKRGVASLFGVPDRVFDSWLLTLNTVRNICAHHGRLWNRVLGNQPMIPRQFKFPDWHRPYSVPSERVFAILTICRYSLTRVAPQSRWSRRFVALLEAYPHIPIREMGFPENWRESPLWKGAADGG